MEYRQLLANNLLSESVAYGYTLSIWGAGALLIDTYQPPGVGPVFLFIGGSLAAFATLAFVAFSEPFTSVASQTKREPIAASIIHIVATLGNLLGAKGLLILAQHGHLGLYASAVLVGYEATIAYNLFLLLETRIVRLVA